MDIEVATNHCVFRANAHRYVCSVNTDPDVDFCKVEMYTVMEKKTVL
jgi:hypothetical protein